MLCPGCHASCRDEDEACFNCGRALGALTRGDLLAGRYEILARLGRGGMGTVYKAHDRTVDELVALKVLHPELALDADLVRRFRAEVKLARRITHRNVCRIHDYGEDGPLRQFITMAHVEGEDLAKILRAEGALPREETYDIAIAVAEGLQAIHDAGIIHRDLKTSNIMRDSRGLVQLMDFGIAKEWGESRPQHTSGGQVVGTPEYMSPEQIRGERLDFRSDVYGLGVVTYELFAGHVPFRGDSPWATLQKHLGEPPNFDRLPARPLPPSLMPVLAKAMAKRPRDRHATARELAHDLEEARVDTRVRANPRAWHPTVTTPRPRPKRRWRARWAVLGLGGAALTLTAAVLFGRRSGPDHPALQGRPATASATAGLQAPGRPAPSPSQPTPTTGSGPGPTPRLVRDVMPERRQPAVIATPRPDTEREDVETPAATPTPPLPLLSAPRPAPQPSPPANGQVHLVVRPWGEVFVDGKDVGTAPLTGPLQLPPGTHALRIAHPVYGDVVRQVELTSGETLDVRIDLAREGDRQ